MTAIDFNAAAECLRLIAHPGRLALLWHLLRGRYTVGELADLVQLAPSVTSEHLRLMERCQLLRGEREGRKVFYVIAEAHLAKIMACVEAKFALEQEV